MRTRIAGGLLSRALCALDWAYMPNNKAPQLTKLWGSCLQSPCLQSGTAPSGAVFLYG